MAATLWKAVPDPTPTLELIDALLEVCAGPGLVEKSRIADILLDARLELAKQ